MRKCLGLIIISLFVCNISFGQASRVPNLEILVGSSSVGKRIEQLDLPGDLFTGTTSGKRATIALGTNTASLKNNGVSLAGTINIVTTGDMFSSSSYNPSTKTGTMTFDVSGSNSVCTGNDQYTKLLLHGDQVGSLSTYVDASEQEGTVTAVGGVNGTTTQSVFGGASFSMDGTNDRLAIADNYRFELAGNDFMLEMRVRYAGTTTSYLIGKEQAAGSDFVLFYYLPANDSLVFQQKSSSSFVVNAESGSCSVSLNTWYHFSVIRKGSKFRFYVDGVQKGADVLDADSIVDNTGVWTIGGVPSDSVGFSGYMDEIRFTIGTGRKPSGLFSLPTTAYGSFTGALAY